LLLLFFTLAAVLKVARGEVGSLLERIFGLLLVIACTSASAHLIAPPASAAMPVGNGGLLGYALGHLLTEHLSRLGTTIVLVASWLVGLIFTTQGWVLKLPSMMGRVARASAETASVARDFAGATAAAFRSALPATEGRGILSPASPLKEPPAIRAGALRNLAVESVESRVPKGSPLHPRPRPIRKLIGKMDPPGRQKRKIQVRRK